MAIEQDILKKFADELSESISRKTISSLRKIKDTLSGNETGLKNIWDEICVQKQDEDSFNWDKYEVIVLNLISDQIRKLKEHEKLSILLQTGKEFEFEYDSKCHKNVNSIPIYFIEDLAEYIAENFTYVVAFSYKNMRINKYLNR